MQFGRNMRRCGKGISIGKYVVRHFGMHHLIVINRFVSTMSAWMVNCVALANFHKSTASDLMCAMKGSA